MKGWLVGAVLGSIFAVGSVASAEAPPVPVKWKGDPPKVAEGKKTHKTAAWGWQDAKGGLHFRVTTPFRTLTKPYRVTGSVCGIGKKIGSVNGVLLEKNQDSAKIGPKGYCVWFDFKTNGHIDGFDFTTAAKVLRLAIRVDGKLLDVNSIHIGKKDNHPKTNPAVIPR
ncbi:MAG: hypothetical protein JRI23_35990 [Deltaproteobacteria bacterium]|jgi:hypothetical protein|nr:hypothetical protein [Deltaproteobacteria bacterium]MBW2537752.1 hypothetical protein [Deltaproteobacteria bacterium]